MPRPGSALFHPNFATSFQVAQGGVAELTAMILRAAPTSGRGRRGPQVWHINVLITPLLPANQETSRDAVFRLRQELDTPMEFLETTTATTRDIREGDILVVDNKEYPIRDVSDQSIEGVTMVRLLVEDVK